PAIRRILPPSVRPALSVVPESNPGDAFVHNGYYPWTPTDPLKSAFGSFSEKGNGAVGRLVSGPLACSQGKALVFEVAGYLGGSGLSLVLEEGTVRRPVVPARVA